MSRHKNVGLRPPAAPASATKAGMSLSGKTTGGAAGSYRNYAAIVLIIISGFMCYTTSLSGNFIWDDNFLIKNNPAITSFHHIPELFTKTVNAKTRETEAFWRPLQMLSYAIDYHLWKYNVTGYHAVNALLHILVSLCLYWMLLLILSNRTIAGFSAALFTVHPIQTETVSYISDRADLFAALFILLTFIWFIKYLGSKRIYFFLLMIGSFILALLSKENALITPLLLLLYCIAFKTKIPAKELGSLCMVIILYIGARLLFLQGVGFSPFSFPSAIERIPGFFAAVAHYMRLLAAPFGLHAAYGKQLFPLFNPWVLAGIAITAGLLVFAYKKRTTDPVLFFSIGWFFIALLPTSNIYAISFYMAEHFLYVPGIGFFIILGLILETYYRRGSTRIFTSALFAALFSLYGGLTFLQNKYWTLKPAEFYKKTIHYSPYEPMLHHNLAQEYFLHEKIDSAIAELTATLKLNSSYPGTHSLLAMSYYRIGEKQKAKSVLEHLVASDTGYAPGYYLLGSIHNEAGNPDDAVTCFRKALRASDRYADAYFSLAVVYKNALRLESARSILLQGIKNCPDEARLFNLLGLVYGDMGSYENAVSAFNRALVIDASAGNVCNNLAVVYFQMKNFALAREYALKALRLGYNVNPEFLEDIKKRGW